MSAPASNLEVAIYYVRKHGEIIVQDLRTAQHIEAHAFDTHGYSFGIHRCTAGYVVIDLDA